MPETLTPDGLIALSGLSGLPRIGLPEVLLAAPATTRVDRKYLVSAGLVAHLLDRLPPSLRLLTIGDRLTTSYRSTYFDTPDLVSCRAHVQRRRVRWKARSRLYVEDGLCRLELKLSDGSGLTRKAFLPRTSTDYGLLDGGAQEFLRVRLRTLGLDPTGLLGPAAEVTYRRATLADPDSGARVTIDVGVRATRHGHAVELDPDCLVVETKGGRVPGAADRLLGGLGARPRSFSKYAASVSLIDPGIPDNDVRRLLGRQLHLRPVSDPTLDTLRRSA